MSQFPLIPLTGEHKNAYIELAEKPPVSPAFALTGDVNPDLRVFVVNFDGTGNDKDAPSVPGTGPSLVATTHEQFNALGNPSVASRYYKGVGTDAEGLDWAKEAALGSGVLARAKMAYEDLCSQVEEWRAENPNCDVHVHVTGFSRGCASALKFMHMVDKVGIPKFFMDERLRGGALKTSAVLIDAVTTGVESRFSDGLKAEELTLPPTNISTLHIVAGGEERKAFELTSLADPLRPNELAVAKNVWMEGRKPDASGNIVYRRLHQVTLPCARHSDAGGVFTEGGIRPMPAYLMAEFQRTLGLPVRGIKPTLAAIQGMHATDLRWSLRSRLERIFDETDIKERQSATRRVAKAPKGVWDGDGHYTERITMSWGAGDNRQGGSNVRLVQADPKDWRAGKNLPELCRNYVITFSLSESSAAGQGKLEVSCGGGANFYFDESDGTFLMNEMALNSVPKRHAVEDLVRASGPVRLALSFEKGIPTFDAQCPNAATLTPGDKNGLPLKKGAPQDNVPTAVLEAIKRVNAQGSAMLFLENDVAELVYNSMQSASQAISAKFPAVRAIRVHDFEEVAGEWGCRIVCERDGLPPFDLGSECDSREDFHLAQALRTLEGGLNCLRRAIAAEGVEGPKMGTQVFRMPAAAVGINPGLGGSVLSPVQLQPLGEPQTEAKARPRLRVVS